VIVHVCLFRIFSSCIPMFANSALARSVSEPDWMRSQELGRLQFSEHQKNLLFSVHACWENDEIFGFSTYARH
jgi:hypothetical protein